MIKDFFSDVFYHFGPAIFLFVLLFLFSIGLGIWDSCTVGTEDCLHLFQDGDFCSYCGVALHEFCSSCGSVIDGASFCGCCGAALN